MNLVQSFRGTRKRATPEIIAARFWANLTKSSEADGCWTWTGTVELHGYGRISTHGRGGVVLAHRLSYELHHGPIAPGMCVCHRCDVRTCVNPAHLFLGTLSDNQRDKIAKGRTPKGEDAGPAKITEAKALEIIAAIASGEGNVSVARRLGVGTGTVTGIKSGVNWKHLPRPDGMRPAASRSEQKAQAFRG